MAEHGGMLAPRLARYISDIRAPLSRAAKLDARSIEADISARWAEAQAGYRWALRRTRLQAYKELGITEEQGTQDAFGCGVQSMRRRLRLYKNFKTYEANRRAEPNPDYWGLKHALTTIPLHERYGTNAQLVGNRSVTKRGRGTGKLDLSRVNLWTGDAVERMKAMPTGSVRCIITSPPFWPTKRSFGLKGIGFEPTLAEYITHILAIFRECMRVLADDGIMWLHLEDGHSHSGGHWNQNARDPWTKQARNMEVRTPSTLDERPAKCLLMVPAQVAIAMMNDGWLLRSHIIWDKGFARPDGAQDRPTTTHADIFMFVKQPHYNYDRDPLRVAYRTTFGRSVNKLHTLGRLPNSPRTGSMPGVPKRGVLNRSFLSRKLVYASPMGRKTAARSGISLWRLIRASIQRRSHLRWSGA